ncbi:MAG: phage major capsid protein [Protaetiibacter sp.]
MHEFEHGEFSFDAASRTLRGLLIPFGELSRTSASGQPPVLFERGSVTLPRDPSVVTLNRHHDRFDPVGRAISLTETDRGIEAEFRLADTEEADDYLTSAKGTLRKLSAEVRDIVRNGASASARLTGAALVTEGAFASAALFEISPEEAQAVVDAVTDALANVTAIDADTAAEVIEEVADEITPAEDEQETNTDSAPEEDNPEKKKNQEFEMADATIPTGAVAPVAPETSARGLFAAVATRDFDALKRYSTTDNVAAFAIENIQQSGTSTKTIGADTAQVGYLGEIWQGNPYQRKFTPLFAQNTLTSYKAVGWKWDPDNAPEVAAYAGNTAEVNSNAIDTTPVTVDAQRVAGGNRIDRRFLDFNDQEVIASYFRRMAEHYARVTDAAALAAAVTGAGSDLTVTGKTYPYNSPVAIAAIVDGALQVLSEDATPTFAVVSPELWRDLALVGNNDVLGYLQAGFGLESGSVDGFKIIPGAVGTGKVLVGAREGLQFFEMGGSPIRVDALAVHNGALDGALYGYYATLATGKGLSIVDTTDYTAPTAPTVIVNEAA